MGCLSCNSKDLKTDFSTNIVYCVSCGEIACAEQIDPQKEWRTFDLNQTTRDRVSGTTVSEIQQIQGTYTDIDSEYSSVAVQKKEKSVLFKAKKLKKWYHRTKIESTEDKNLVFALIKLNQLLQKKIIDAKIKSFVLELYQEATNKKLIKGRTFKGIIYSLILYALRKNKYPCSFKQVCQALEISRKELGRSYRYLISKLNLKLKKNDVFSNLESFVKDQTISPEEREEIKEIYIRISSIEEVNGKGEYSLLFSILELFLQKKNKELSKKQISLLEISKGTIKNRIKEIKKYF